MKRALSIVAIASLLVGCGPTVSEICDNLESSCPEIGSDCEDDGEALEDWASDSDCATIFDDYLACLDHASCDWRQECGEERNAIAECVGRLPD